MILFEALYGRPFVHLRAGLTVRMWKSMVMDLTRLNHLIAYTWFFLLDTHLILLCGKGIG